MIKLRNYTSTVPIERSVMMIEQLLASAGASQISKTYGKDGLSGIIFHLNVGAANVAFKLPSRVDRVEHLFRDEIRRPRRGTMEKITEQSRRTAWKLLHDWICVQVSMIKLEQIEPMEVFLPYAYDQRNDSTFFEKLKTTGFKMLKAGDGTKE